MKKIIVVLTLNYLLTVAAHAGTVGMSGLWNFEGQMSMTDPTGFVFPTDPVIGEFDFDSGLVNLALDSPFFGPETWYAIGAIEDQLDGTYLGSLESIQNTASYNWNILLEITQSTTTANVMSFDSDGDGIPGTAFIYGPFPGFTEAINGTLTAVPLPTTVWLFGSGLIGLVGFARRNKN